MSLRVSWLRSRSISRAVISDDSSSSPAPDSVGCSARGACCVDGVRMRQLNTVQAMVIALGAAAALYVIGIGLFIMLGDIARWAL